MEIPRNDTSRFRSLWIGAGVSSLVLLFCVAWTVSVIAAIARPSVVVEVTGHQWWWQVRYLNDDPSRVFTTANEIHIPVGRKVVFKLMGSDVVHSFWVPELAGRTDLVPGEMTETWLEARKPGTYHGQCTEYCGVEHEKMGFVIVADKPADFARWQAHQLQSQAAPTGDAAMGAAVFNTHCAGCHAVRGTDAAGAAGPDLSHLMQRRTLGAGIVPNDPAALAKWIADPQAAKPGSLMRKPELSDAELAQIDTYLGTLR